MRLGMQCFIVTTRIRDGLMLAAYWLFFVCIRISGFCVLRGSPDVCHGPVTWPWWKLVHVDVVKLSTAAPTLGWGIWIYTRRRGEPSVDHLGIERRNVGRCIDIVIDRRVRIIALHRNYPC